MSKKQSAEVTPKEEMILFALYDKELYGLEILEVVRDASDGKKEIMLGTLYPVLHSLEKKGLIESRWGDEKPRERGGARRRYYRLTESGEISLKAIQNFQKNLLSWQPERVLNLAI